MPKLVRAHNIAIILAIWAAVACAQHHLSSRTCPGSRGGTVQRGTVTGRAKAGVTVTITSRDCGTRIVEATHSSVAGIAGRLSAGQRVFVEIPQGNNSTGAAVVGLVRDRTMVYLAGVFLSFFVLVGGRQAAGSVAGLIVVFAGTVFVFVPMMIAGVGPRVAVLLASAGMAAVISLLISGIHRRTAAIVAGSIGGLLITCALSGLASFFLRMTGVYSKLTMDLWFTDVGRRLDFIDLLSAGITLGALGVVIDLATAVASAVFEVADANPALSRRSLALSGLRVGRDVMGTELNTLVFAYAGARVGVLLLPFFGPQGYELPVIQVLSLQELAAEVAHIVVGTAGLILTIPLTAFIAGLLAPGRQAHTGGAPAAVRVRRRGWIVWPAAVASWAAVAAIALWLNGDACHTYARDPSTKTVTRLVRAEARAVDPPPAQFEGRAKGERKQTVTAQLLTGPMAASQITVHNAVSGFPAHDKVARPGDGLLLKTMSRDEEVVASIIDYDRARALIAMVWGVGMLAMAVGGRNGLKAMGALGLCAPLLGGALYLIVAFELPALPMLTVAALLMCGGVFIVLAGPTRKAASAAGGAFSGIAVGGFCAAAAGAVMSFTGLQSESLFAIRMFGGGEGIDYRGLLSAGILLGIVGVAMDVAIAVASSVEEVARAKPGAGRAELWRRGMSVGRKVMCTMVLALVFAYLGANLPLLILPRAVEGMPMLLALNNDRFACEELRILAGGIGVVAAIPATALLASILMRRRVAADAEE